MTLYAVLREAGPAWTDGKGAFEQTDVDDHAGFMGTLADEGFLLFAGPLAGTEGGRIRVLLIADADGEDEVHRVLSRDPWEAASLLVTSSVEPWKLLVGAERLAVAEVATP